MAKRRPKWKNWWRRGSHETSMARKRMAEANQGLFTVVAPLKRSRGSGATKSETQGTMGGRLGNIEAGAAVGSLGVFAVIVV